VEDLRQGGLHPFTQTSRQQDHSEIFHLSFPKLSNGANYSVSMGLIKGMGHELLPRAWRRVWGDLQDRLFHRSAIISFSMTGFLTTKISANVDRITQDRGRLYFLRGAVNLLEGDAWRVEAAVQGTRRYHVSISREKNSFEVSCTCPYYERELETCKHIWATFLAAEQEGYLEGSRDIPPRQIQEVGPRSFPDEEPERPPRTKKPPPPSWKQQLQGLRGAMEAEEGRPRNEWLPERELVYLIDVQDTLASERLTVEVAQRDRKMDGSWGKLKSRRIRFHEIANLSNPGDRRILALLLGAREEISYRYSSYYYDSASSSYALAQPVWDVVLPLMCATERCFLRVSLTDAELQPIQWDDGDLWELWLKITLEDAGERYLVTGLLRRAEAEMELAKPALLLAGGLVFYDGRVACLQDFGAFGWISLLRGCGSLSIPKKEADHFLSELLRLPRRPRLELPDELKFETVSQRPKPCLIIKPGERNAWGRARLVGELSFEYEGEIIPYKRPGQGIYQRERRRLILRDIETEVAAEKRLKQLGFRSGYATEDSEFELLPDYLPKVVRALTNEGWRVEAQGKLYRTPGELRMEISSGIDWFELSGGAQFGASTVSLPELLMALKRGDHTVRLDDGTLGILPEEWMKKYGILAGLGTVEGNNLRFRRQQIGLLDALLASEPEATADAIFERARQELPCSGARRFLAVRGATPMPRHGASWRGLCGLLS
jgi:hypothetical protein